MFTRLINVAIAVNDLEAAVERFKSAFGFELQGEITSQPALGLRAAVLSAAGSTIELISPVEGEQILRRFLDTRGEGVYRIAFGADDIAPVVAHFDESNVRYADLSSQAGFGLVFTHPKSAHGVMVEVVEERSLQQNNA